MTPEATTQTLWNIAMVGGYTGYYYTYTAWDVIRPLDKPTGYTYMKHFGDFWRGTEYWKLVPSDSLVNHGWCIAQPGMEYVVYQEQAQPFRLDIARARATLSGEWFNAFTGQRTGAGEFENGMAKLSPPKEWPDAPLVLHLKPANVKISGEAKQWHAVTLTIDGPQASETDVDPNPYLDYAFSVTFTHESGSPTYSVPGYFAADGNAAQSCATSGNQWRAHLSPDKTGMWNYQIHFQRGKQVASGDTGTPINTLDGMVGTFNVDPSDKSGQDLRAHGRLQYVGEHYLQFAGSKEYFLKVGADSPETLLAYTDFDGTVATKKQKNSAQDLDATHPRLASRRSDMAN